MIWEVSFGSGGLSVSDMVSGGKRMGYNSQLSHSRQEGGVDYSGLINVYLPLVEDLYYLTSSKSSATLTNAPQTSTTEWSVNKRILSYGILTSVLGFQATRNSSAGTPSSPPAQLCPAY